MRLFSAALATTALVALAGCSNTSPPGGSGPNVGKKATFDIKPPMTSTTVKQGETKEVKLAIDRGKDFHDPVELKFEPASGLSVDPKSETVNAEQKDVTIRVTADKNATVGDETVRVMATPPHGSSTSTDVKIKVEKGEGPK